MPNAHHTVFLLSPASCSGKRARSLLRPSSTLELALSLRQPSGAPLAEVFRFTSGLYFRGKLVYARRFARPPNDCAGVQVITAGRGLLRPEDPVTAAELEEMAGVPVDAAEARYRAPLLEDAGVLERRLGENDRAVLLGSVATDKYVEPLLEIFGGRLFFPAEFVGRGDMSRGGLLLRRAESGEELSYVAAANARRRGSRPPRLEPRRPSR